MTSYPLGSRWKRKGIEDIYVLGKVEDYLPKEPYKANSVSLIRKRKYGGMICYLRVVVKNPDEITDKEFKTLNGRATFYRVKEIKKCLSWTK